MYGNFQQHLNQELDSIKAEGLYKTERPLTSPQDSRVGVEGMAGAKILNLCANNYLGLAQHPAVQEAARQGLDEWGYGMASVRFICGTQTLHKTLEQRLSDFLGMEDTIVYPPVSMRTVGCSRPCWGQKTPLFLMPLITPAS